MKSGTLKKIDDFTCQNTQLYYTNYFEFIGVKKDTECSMHKKNGLSAEIPVENIYNISTICEISGKM